MGLFHRFVCLNMAVASKSLPRRAVENGTHFYDTTERASQRRSHHIYRGRFHLYHRSGDTLLDPATLLPRPHHEMSYHKACCLFFRGIGPPWGGVPFRLPSKKPRQKRGSLNTQTRPSMLIKTNPREASAHESNQTETSLALGLLCSPNDRWKDINPIELPCT